MNKSEFRIELEHAINRNSMENGSDTPDFILAGFLTDCLDAFDRTLQRREVWYGRCPKVSPNAPFFGIENGKPPTNCPLVGCTINGPHEHKIGNYTFDSLGECRANAKITNNSS